MNNLSTSRIEARGSRHEVEITPKLLNYTHSHGRTLKLILTLRVIRDRHVGCLEIDLRYVLIAFQFYYANLMPIVGYRQFLITLTN